MARAIDAEVAKKRLQAWIDESDAQGFDKEATYFQNCISLLDAVPTLTPPNEWVNRVRELDELYTKLQIVTGFTAEQLLEIFAAGYTLEKPDYSKKFAEMENLAEAAQPNDPLTIEQLREMEDPVWCVCKTVEGFEGFWCLCDHGYILTPARQIFDVKEILHWVFYRRPPEGEEDT